MIRQFLYSIISCIILLFIIIKLRYRFWASQPIFHTYNLWYWLVPPGIIQHNIPEKTKFFDPLIDVMRPHNISTEKKALIFSFLKMHYEYLKKIAYNPSKGSIITLLKGNSYISLRYSSYKKNIIACLTSRPLECNIGNQTLTVSYFDYLCVHPKYRKKGAAAKLLYTHYQSTRALGNQPVFVFKRTGSCGINTPIALFKTYIVASKPYERVNLQLPNNISTHIIQTYNCELLIHFLREVRMNFDCVIKPKTVHLVDNISNGYIIPTVILDNQTVVCVTLFKNPQIYIDDNLVLECIGSYCRRGYEKYFKSSFTNSIVLLKKKFNFSYIKIENISHNYHLIKKILKISIPKWILSQGYYFYNFAYRPFFSPNVFIIQ